MQYFEQSFIDESSPCDDVSTDDVESSNTLTESKQSNKKPLKAQKKMSDFVTSRSDDVICDQDGEAISLQKTQQQVCDDLWGESDDDDVISQVEEPECKRVRVS